MVIFQKQYKPMHKTLRDRFNLLLLLCELSLSFFLIMAFPVNADVSVHDRVNIAYSNVLFNRRTQAYEMAATITNSSESPVYGPISLIIRNILPNAVELDNADGVTADGAKFIGVALKAGKIAPNEAVKTVLRFKNPNRVRFTFEDDIRGNQISISEPGSSPFALSNNKLTTVKFTVRASSTEQNAFKSIMLQRLDSKESFPLNDSGQNGDASAADGVYTSTVNIDTTGKEIGDCLQFQAESSLGGSLLISPVHDLCVTGFPTKIKPSDLNASNQIDFSAFDDPAPAVANEIVLEFNDETTETRIREIVQTLNGTVSGTVLPAGIYQVELPNKLSANEMFDVISSAKMFSEVKAAYPNLIGMGAAGPVDDTEYNSNHQPGLFKIRAQEAWDYGDGSNIAVAILDSGVFKTHEDFNFVPNNTLENDVHGHGTKVTGIYGAATNNTLGIAGAVGATPGQQRDISVFQILDQSNLFSLTNYQQKLNQAIGISPKIMNMSFGGNWNPTNCIYRDALLTLCSKIKTITDAGTLVVAAAGNFSTNTPSNGTRVYPASCNVDNGLDPNDNPNGCPAYSGPEPRVAHKQRLIVVANSNDDDTLNSNSYFGTWVDVAAPGTNILSTKKGGGYDTDTGTSYSAPLVAGTTAVLLSRYPNDPDKLDKIEEALKNSAPAQVSRNGVSVGRISMFDSLRYLDEPPVISNQTFTIPENSANSTLVSQIAASDPENDDISFNIIGGNQGNPFSIDNFGNLTVSNSGMLDFETTPHFSLTVEAIDSLGKASQASVYLNLTDVVEPQPAVFTIYNNRNSYLAAIGSNARNTQDFEGIAVGTNMMGVEFIPGLSAVHNGGGLNIFNSVSVGRTLLRTTSNTAVSFYTLSNNSSYDAIGFDIAAYNPATGSGTVRVTFADQTSTSVTIDPSIPASRTESDPIFFGVIANQPIRTIVWSEGLEIENFGCCEETGLDNFVVTDLP